MLHIWSLAQPESAFLALNVIFLDKRFKNETKLNFLLPVFLFILFFVALADVWRSDALWPLEAAFRYSRKRRIGANGSLAGFTDASAD